MDKKEKHKQKVKNVRNDISDLKEKTFEELKKADRDRLDKAVYIALNMIKES